MKKRTDFPSIVLLLSAAGLTVVLPRAGGRRIALGATVILSRKGVSKPPCRLLILLPAMFLIQSWVASADGSRSTDFIITYFSL